MGAFSVAISAWVISTLAPNALESNAELASLSVSAIESETALGLSGSTEFAAPTVFLDGESEIIAGFRMEGAPEIDVVFGDSARYRSHVDRFYDLDGAMDTTRASFKSNVRDSIAVLATTKRRCPTQRLAPSFYSAKREILHYRRLGRDLEAQYRAIRTLDDLGESAALTPDYRWKVNRIRSAYRAALVDMREMGFALRSQLMSEMRYRGCSQRKLLTIGATAVVTAEPAPAAVAAVAPTPSEVVPASTATFFIDNTSCETTMHIHLDGARIGAVEAGARTAFQTLTGRHTLCLVAPDSGSTCGETGTLRNVYLHDGWSITAHCESRGRPTSSEPRQSSY